MIAESGTEEHPNQLAEITEAFIPDNIADAHLPITSVASQGDSQ